MFSHVLDYERGVCTNLVLILYRSG